MLKVLEKCLLRVLAEVPGRLVKVRDEEPTRFTASQLTYELVESSGSELSLESLFISAGSTVMKTFF